MQILILGMHRSGTSALTRLINMMGAYFGPEGSVGEITDDNPKGFWERPEIFKLNETILRAKGCSWDKLQHWVFKDVAIIPNQLEKQLQKLVLGMDAFRPWVLKDPRMCLLLPAWKPFLEVPVAILVYRDPVEIALSLQKRDSMSLEYAIALWEYHTVGMLNASNSMPRIFVRHSDLLQKPVKTCEAVFKKLVELGVRRLEMPTPQEIKAFIDPKLHRAKAPAAGIFKLSDNQKALVEMLQGTRPQKAPARISERSLTVMQGKR